MAVLSAGLARMEGCPGNSLSRAEIAALLLVGVLAANQHVIMGGFDEAACRAALIRSGWTAIRAQAITDILRDCLCPGRNS